MQCIHEPHQAATGFIRNKSIVDNAKLHSGSNYVYNIDLKDFFHSFDRNRVKMGFFLEPFGLKGDREPLAFLLASLCTHPFEIEGEVKTVLPQGSPTSPTITNILCHKLDHRLSGMAKRFGIKYSRYADDITFSSQYNIYKEEEFINELNRIIGEDQGLEINPLKTRLQKQGYRQEVTGLIVNEKPNVKSRYIKQLRMWLYYWEKYGYERASKIFISDYVKEKGHVKSKNPNFESVLDGKLEFLKMVKGKEDSTYLKLLSRFTKLNNSLSNKGKTPNDTENRNTTSGKKKPQKKFKESLQFLENIKSDALDFGEINNVILDSLIDQVSIISQTDLSQHKEINYGIDLICNMEMGNRFANQIDKEFKRIDLKSNLISGKILKKVEILVNNLEHLKIDEEQKSTLNALIDKELQQFATIDEKKINDIRHRIPQKRQFLSLNSKSIEKEDEIISIQKIKLPVFHTPQKLVSILKIFSINNSALKYSTHSWDAGVDGGIFNDLDDFLKQANKEFNKVSIELKDLKKELHAKIYSFLFNKDVKIKGWGTHRIKFGWSSPELLEELRREPNTKPENIIIPDYAQIQLKLFKNIRTIQEFRHVIDVFKNEIEIRDENSALKNLILEFHSKHLKGFEIEIVNLENKNFYTDVDYLRKGLDLIFESIKKRPQHNRVVYAGIDSTTSFTLEIIHLQSFATGRSIKDEKLSLTTGDFGTIKDNLRNLCDWSIESDFMEGKYRINFLVSDPLTPHNEQITDCEGFKYSFTFYK